MGFISINSSVYGEQRITDTGSCFADSLTKNSQLLKTVSMTRNSVNSPDFKGKNQRRELLPHNAFSYFREQLDYPAGTWIVTSNKVCNGKVIPAFRTTSGTLFGSVDYVTAPAPLTFSAARLTSLGNKSTQDLLLKVKDQRVNLGQVMGERSQVVKTFTSTVTNISGAITQLKKGNLLGASSHLGISVSKRKHSGFKTALARSRLRQDGRKVPANLSKHVLQFEKTTVDECLSSGWLALQYGWLPLLQDIQGGLETLYESQHRPDERYVKSKRFGDFLELDLRWSYAQYNGRDKSNSTAHIQSRAQFRAATKYLSDAAPLGILNPASVLWELLPWSFVIDWFLPIGNYVNSLDATAGLQFVDGSQTTFQRRTVVRSVTGQKWNGLSYAGAWGAKREQISCNRVKFTTFPATTLPEFKSPISFVHFANSLSLLIQLRK